MNTLREAAADGNRIAGPGASQAGGAGSPAGRVTAVGVLDRAAGLLDVLAGGPLPLRLLAERAGLPRPTAHRLLVSLEAHGLVARGEGGAFRLGPRLTELAVRAGPAIELAAVSAPVLARLHAQTGESVQLYVRSADRRLCVAARDAGAGLRDSVPVGALLPLDAGSGGKVLLAWSPDAARFPAATAAELAAIRRRGWAASVAEREAGVASVSAPVLRHGRPEGARPAGPAARGTAAGQPAGDQPGTGRPGTGQPGTGQPETGQRAAGGVILAALCVSGPASRLGPSPGKNLAPLVVAAADELAGLAAGLS